jgi:uncharacterized membrane protein YphA (DoxX/SURF4 family)
MRLAVGVIFLAHGAQKVLGHTDLSALLANLLGGLEVFIGLAILVGWSVRLWASVLSLLVLADLAFSHPPQVFFLPTKVGPEEVVLRSFEYPLALLGLCLGLMSTGAGRMSVENWLTPRSPDDSDVGIGKVQR